MRIKLSLRVRDESDIIPYDYQYYLSIAIYSALSKSSAQYAGFLHDHGYMGPDNRLRKLFVFSRLIFSKRLQRNPAGFIIEPDTEIILYVSSPMLQDFMRNFVTGLFSKQSLRIGSSNLFVQGVEALPDPVIHDHMPCLCLSPIVVKRVLHTPEGKSLYYARPLDQDLSEAIRNSAIRKYQTIYNKPPQDSNLEFVIDRNYIERKGGPLHVAKLVTLKKGTPQETRIKGFEAPFVLSGSPDLIRTLYDCGIGDQGSMGFGCVGFVGGERRV